MGKGKPPRKRKDPGTEAGESERDVELVAPTRRPPTAVGAETPLGLQPARSAFGDIIAAIRLAAAALLDLADATADAVRRQIERRA